jgi:rubrerythrin
LSLDTPNLTLEQLDVDGAIQESAAGVDSDTRAAFLRKAGVFGGTIVASGAALGGLPALAEAKGSLKRDISILNFALTLEYLEAAFYKEAQGTSGVSGSTRQLLDVVTAHEATHVKFLKKALGKKAVKSPKFDFGSSTASPTGFLKTAFTLENEGVAAYSGQGPYIHTFAYVKAALSILTIEARHAAAFAYAAGHVTGKTGISPNGAFDKPKTKAHVLKDVKKTKFIVS